MSLVAERISHPKNVRVLIRLVNILVHIWKSYSARLWSVCRPHVPCYAWILSFQLLYVTLVTRSVWAFVVAQMPSHYEPLRYAFGVLQSVFQWHLEVSWESWSVGCAWYLLATCPLLFDLLSNTQPWSAGHHHLTYLTLWCLVLYLNYRTRFEFTLQCCL